jgi:sporulation protein YunB
MYVSYNGCLIKNHHRIKILKHTKKAFSILFALILLCCLVMIYIQNVINEKLIVYSEFKINNLVEKEIDFVAFEIINENNATYDNLVVISKTDEGEINFVEVNMVKINMLAQEICEHSVIKINSVGSIGLGVPIGAFSGISVLKNVGPDINLHTEIVGAVNYDIETEFKVENIGYTNHKVYINVEAFVRVSLVLSAIKLPINIKFLLCESIIMGRIPQYYSES